MKRTLLLVSYLALALVAALIVSASAGLADTPKQVEGARPTPTPDGGGPKASTSGVDIPLLPDLVVSRIGVVPANPLIGEPVVVEVTIQNRGQADVSLGPPPNNFLSDLYVDPAVTPIQLGQNGEVEFPCQAWWVPAGGSWTLQAAYVFTDVRTFKLYAQVDTDNHVGEANENNNVLGPVNIEVRAPNQLTHETHQDFQLGLASGLDLTHPDGVMRRGIFWQPYTEITMTEGLTESALLRRDVYYPDVMVNDKIGMTDTVSGELIPTTVYQVRPSITGDGKGNLFVAWEDGQNGYYSRDIMVAQSFDEGKSWVSLPQSAVEPLKFYNLTEDTGGTATSPDVAYDPHSKRVYVVWQDDRRGHSDIYLAYLDDTEPEWKFYPEKNGKVIPLNDDLGIADQVRPAIVVDPSTVVEVPVDPDDPTTLTAKYGAFYVVWQDRRSGNDDIFIVQPKIIAGGVVTTTTNYAVTDDPEVSAQNRMAPSIDVDLKGGVYVAWEDWRYPENPEIYMSWSTDLGVTFGVDIPVDIPGRGSSYRIEPALGVSTTREYVDRWDPALQMTLTVPCDITAVHLAWQEGQGDEADVYYNYATHTWWTPPEYADLCAQIDPCEAFPYDFCFNPPHDAQMLNGWVIDSEYVLPADSAEPWSPEPSWQGQVSLIRASDLDWTYCHAGSNITYSKGVFVTWTDAGSFDDWRHEIQVRRVGAPEGDPEVYETCEDQASGVLNDNAKLYAYRDDLDQYEVYQPAATLQLHPALYSAPPSSPSFAPDLNLVWDDDRWDAPMEPGTVRNRDVFYARWGMAPEAIYVSPVIDGRSPQSTWYALAWQGATEHLGDLLMQTRVGNDPYPPMADVETATWTRWSGNPSTPAYGCAPGAGCYYDIPGRAIVDAAGGTWPEARYIQYKVIIRGYDRITALSRVTIHYKGMVTRYLPIVVRNR